MSIARLDPKRSREILNAVRISYDVLEGRTHWRGRPFHVEVSTNNACNLACVMCERPDLSWIKAQQLDRIGGQVFPQASIVTPSATSEPAMGDFDRIVDHCERHDLRLNLITNGNLIRDRHVERLRGRIFRLDFSLDAHVPAVYEKIRRGGRFDRMLGGLRRLVALQQEEGFPLTLVIVLMSENLSILPSLPAFARDEGVSRVRVQKMLPFFRDPQRLHVREAWSEAEVRDHLDRTADAAEREGIFLQLDLDPPSSHGPAVPEPEVTTPAVAHAILEALMERRPGTCFQLGSYIRIIPSGDVFPCCRGWDADLRMGNVNEAPIEEIWNGPEYALLREEFSSGQLRPICASCTLSGQGTL